MPISPINPEPRSHTAAGIGTGAPLVNVTSSIVKLNDALSKKLLEDNRTELMSDDELKAIWPDSELPRIVPIRVCVPSNVEPL